MGMSKADIFNLALRHLQITKETIYNPDDEDDPLAVTFTAYWNKHIPKELELWDWQFARGVVALGPATEFTVLPYPKLTEIYHWPAKCLAPRFIVGNSRDDNIPLQIGVQGTAGQRKKLIYTSREEAVLVFTENIIADYALFPFAFNAAIAARLALEHALFKMGGGDRVKGIKEAYTALVIEARQQDAQMINYEHYDQMQTSRYHAARGDSPNLSLAGFAEGE